MLMIIIYLILRILQQHILNLKNSYKHSKTLIQYNFLVEGFIFWRKISPLKPLLPISSISSSYSFLFFVPNISFPSPPNSQTKPKRFFFCLLRKQSTWIMRLIALAWHCGANACDIGQPQCDICHPFLKKND